MSDTAPRPPRLLQPRRWTASTLLGATMGLAVAGAAQARDQIQFGQPHAPERLWMATGDGGEAGEAGEAGEGGAGAAADTVPGLLDQLGQIEGHLRTARALYDPAAAGDAPLHAGHPQAEVYGNIGDRLDAIGAPQFDDDLTALDRAMRDGAPVEAIDAALAAVLARIDEARMASGATDRDRLLGINLLLRTAAAEYGVGVNNGAVVELTEYRDAWGFVQAARRTASEVAGSSDPEAATAGQAAQAALDGLDAAFPGVTPAGSVDGDAGLVLAAAARIELAAYGIR